MNANTQPAPTLATPSLKVAFLGLGVMGYPMARHLAQAGHAVCVYNRTTAKAERWLAEIEDNAPAGRHRLALTPREAAQDADIVFSCVGNDDDLRSVVLGEDDTFGVETECDGMVWAV